MLIRTGDTVEVIAGNDRGQKSRVIKVDRATGKALVEGVNRVKKHIRRSQKYPQGGVLSKEMPVQLSNVQYFCQSVRQRGSAGRPVPGRRQQGTVLQEVRHERRPDRPSQGGPRHRRRKPKHRRRQNPPKQRQSSIVE